MAAAVAVRESRLVAIVDDQLHWRYVSPATQEILGFEPGDIEGRPVRSFLHPDDQDAGTAFLTTALANKAARAMLRVRTAHGSWRRLAARARRHVEHGRPLLHVSLSPPGAGRRRRRTARSVFDSIPEAFLQLDQDYRILHMNEPATRLLGTAVGHLLWEAFPEAVGTAYEAEFRRAMAEGVAVAVEDRHRDLWFSARAYPSPGGLSVFFRDVTEQRRAQEADRLAYQRSLEIAYLKEINAFKTSFINTAAHELGNPLSPVRIQHRILQDALASEDHARARKALETLGRNLDRLTRLVQDILDGARLQASHLVVTPQQADLAATLREAIESYGPAAASASMQLRVDVPERLEALADPQRMAQVIENLLSNAVKYGRPGGRIQVRGHRAGQVIRITVADDGRGIPSVHLPHLFQPFSRVPAPGGPPGSGLGLYVCAGIVNQHGGKIWAESAGTDRGATFHVEIPAWEGEALSREDVPEARLDAPVRVGPLHAGPVPAVQGPHGQLRQPTNGFGLLG